MKTTVFLISVMLAFLSNAQVGMYSARQTIHKESRDIILHSTYDAEKDEVKLEVDGKSWKGSYILLSPAQREELQHFLDTFSIWYEQANIGREEIKRSIGSIYTVAGFKYGDDWHFDYNAEFELMFYCFLNKKKDRVNISLALVLPGATASDNKYMVNDHTMLWLNKDQVKQLSRAINPKLMVAE